MASLIPLVCGRLAKLSYSPNRLHALAVVLLVALFASASARAQVQFRVLYAFNIDDGADGVSPSGFLARDSAANVYGATLYGGAYNFGTIYKLDSDGRETVLHSFGGSLDGIGPYGGVILDAAGNLYGTTYAGGTYNVGTVFKLTPSGQETVLHSFAGGSDGTVPFGGVIGDSSGNLYGTTSTGGSLSSRGTVYKIDTTGRETVLYAFTGGADGGSPSTTLWLDAEGSVYGTTSAGGTFNTACYSGCGTVFKVDATGNETVLYKFTGGADGEYPFSGVVGDGAGNLYGTIAGGRTSYGLLFKLSPGHKMRVIYNFQGGANASGPGLLLRDRVGNIYGVAGGGAYGAGTIFKVDSEENESLLYTFTGRADGRSPYYLFRDPNGTLYGTASSAGIYNSGTVFALSQSRL